MTETKEYNKNGELQAYTANKYDDKGRLISSQHQNLLFANSSDQIISQKDAYEYDKYGYLTQIVYQRILGNNQKTSGCLTCLYDKYGNQIDSNSYYEYDNTANGSAGPTVSIQKKWNAYSTFTNKVRCCEHFAKGFCYYSITSQLKLVTL